MKYTLKNTVSIVDSIDFLVLHEINYDDRSGYYTHKLSARPSLCPPKETKVLTVREGFSSRDWKDFLNWRISRGTLRAKEMILEILLSGAKKALSETSKELQLI